MCPKWSRYSAYKPSGADWLGEIPTHWKLLQIKRLSLVKRGASPRPIDDPNYFDDKGEYSWVRISDVTSSKRYLEETTQRLSSLGKSLSVPLKPGALFLSIAGSVGKPIITRINCCIHDGFVYFPRFEGNPEFLYYIFASGQPYGGLGKLGTQLNLNTDTVGAIHIGYPSYEEQGGIVTYLDRETTRIDALIEKKQRQIELLQEKRTALISHAVTKGLDPNVKMKDSGIEWLGNVPSSWRVMRLRFCATINPTPAEIRGTANDTVVSFVPMEAIGENGGLNLEQTRPLEHVAKGYTYFRDNDVVIAKITPCFENGKGSLVNGLKNGIGFGTTELHVFRPFSRLDGKYLFYLTLSHAFRKIGASYMYGAGGQKRVPDDFVQNFRLAVPLPSEQRTIAAFLDRETAHIDALTEKVKKSIALLREYRTSLISAAVTGKIDVRKEAA